MTSKALPRSQSKPKALEGSQQVEEAEQEAVVNHHGRPVVEILPCTADPEAKLRALRGSVLRYKHPTEPVGVEDWETLA